LKIIGKKIAETGRPFWIHLAHQQIFLTLSYTFLNQKLGGKAGLLLNKPLFFQQEVILCFSAWQNLTTVIIGEVWRFQRVPNSDIY